MIFNSLAADINKSGARVWSRLTALLCLSTSAGVELLGFQSSLSGHGVELWPLRVRVPRLASNFHQHNDAAECKFDCFGWKVTQCNFWVYYTKYYTVAIFIHKPLIYIGFRRAWISVNP